MTAYEKWVSEQTVTNYRFDPNNYQTDANGARYTPGMSQPVTTRTTASQVAQAVNQVANTMSSMVSTGTNRSDRTSSQGGGATMNFYGATADINAGRGILGNIGNYIDTTGWSVQQQMSIPQGSFILGGEKAGGGVSVNPAGTTRIAGYDVQGTAGAILQFATGGLFKPQAQATPGSVTSGIPSSATVVLPSSTGNTGIISPSLNTSQAIAQGASQAGSATAFSGMTFNNLIAVVAGFMFVGAFMRLITGRRR